MRRNHPVTRAQTRRETIPRPVEGVSRSAKPSYTYYTAPTVQRAEPGLRGPNKNGSNLGKRSAWRIRYALVKGFGSRDHF